jgi:signal transduction histidine kinase
LNLRAAELDHAELGQAVRELLASFGQLDPPQLRVVLPETACPLPGVILNHLLNFIREAVTNAVRHAAAKNVDVQIARNAAFLEVKIADDGRGFVTTGAGNLTLGHFGLRGMHERALKMNAQYQLASIPGGGTTVTLVLPLGQQAAWGKPA